MATSDSTQPTKMCKKCGETFPATAYYFDSHSSTLDGLHSWCKRCKSVAYGHQFKSWDLPIKAGHKKCNTCNEIKPFNEFHRTKNSADGYRYACKMCRAAKENFKYKPPVSDGYRRCSACKNEYPANEAHFYRRVDNGHLQSNCISCYSQRQRTYRQKYPERVRARVHVRLARIRGVGGKHTAEDVALQLKTQKGLCWWCGKPLNPKKYHVDHRVPLVKGGDNNPGNIVITHPRCNLKKNAKMPWEFMERLL